MNNITIALPINQIVYLLFYLKSGLNLMWHHVLYENNLL